MAFDVHANLINVTVTVAPSPATSGTTLSISNADRTILVAALTAPFNMLVGPATARNETNCEIVRVSAIGAADSGGVGNAQLTIARQTESGGVNRSILVGDAVIHTMTKKALVDIENYLTGTTSGASLASPVIDAGVLTEQSSTPANPVSGKGKLYIDAKDVLKILTANGVVNDLYLSLYANGIINAGCEVAQRSAPTISTTQAYGQVDMFAAAVTTGATSAGTISQTTSPNVTSTTGKALKIAGLTTTGSGVVSLRYRMESADAKKFKNLTASFGCNVYQDTGGAINYTIVINKPTVADTFSTVTNIVTSGNISVPNTTSTPISFVNQALGDCSNGLEVIITATVGAVTTKNLEFADFQLNKGDRILPFMPISYSQELINCKRYFRVFGNFCMGLWTGATTARFYGYFDVEMRTSPTLTLTTTTPAAEVTASTAVTGSGSTLSGSGIGSKSCFFEINGFSGRSYAQFAQLNGDYIQASAVL